MSVEEASPAARTMQDVTVHRNRVGGGLQEATRTSTGGGASGAGVDAGERPGGTSTEGNVIEAEIVDNDGR
jgi:hypothetical protein